MDGSVKYLNYGNLSQVPEDLMEDCRIRCLCMKRNMLQSLPPSIRKLYDLRELYLESNQIQTLPDEIAELKHLEMLMLARNALDFIPPAVFGIASLKSLNMSLNLIACIPPEIRKLTRLQMLNLTGNKIASIPPEIGKCCHLKILYLDCNTIVSVCKEICMLSQLEELYLSSNRIRVLPNNLQIMSSLLVLTLDNNPSLLCIPGCLASFSNFQYLGLSRCFKNSKDFTSDESVVVLMRSLLGMQCHPPRDLPACLLELACWHFYLSPKQEAIGNLPNALSALVSCPAACCHFCNQVLFSSSQFLLLPLSDFLKVGVKSGTIEMYLGNQSGKSPCVILQFCSHKCFKQCLK